MLTTLTGLPYHIPQNVPRFIVPGVLQAYMQSIIGHTLLHAQNEAIAGNGDPRTQFWGHVSSNNLQNPLMVEFLTHAAAVAYNQLMCNPSIAANSNQWAQQVAVYVVSGYMQQWAMRIPQLVGLYQPQALQQAQAAAQSYLNDMQRALGMFNQAVQQQQMQNSGGSNWSAGTQQMGFGFNNQQQGQSWVNNGQQGQSWANNGGSFNAGGFNTQMANNVYNGSFNSTPSPSLINNGRRSGFDDGPSYNGGTVFDWTTGRATEVAAPNGPGNGFTQVNQQRAIPAGFGGSSAANTFTDSDHARMQNAPLQSLNVVEAAQQQQSVTPTIPLEPSAVKRVMNPPTRYMVKIPLPGGRIQRHLHCFNPKTHVSICDVDCNDIIICEHIVPLEQAKQYMNFEEHNTAPFLVQRGTEPSKVSSSMNRAEISQAALSTIWLENATETVILNNEGLTVDSPELGAKLREYVTKRAVNIDTVISGKHRTAYEEVNAHITNKGIDALMDEVPVFATMIDLDPVTLGKEVAHYLQETMDQKDSGKAQHCFNKLRSFIPTRLWTRLDRDLTNYVNLELYTNFGLDLSIDSFSTDFDDLVALMITDAYGIDYADCEKLTSSVMHKFFAVYSEDNTAGQTTDVDWEGSDGRLSIGTLSRYAFLPINNTDLNLSGNRDMAIVTAQAAPELYSTLQRAFNPLQYSNDPTRHCYIVTSEGEYLLVTKPSGLGQYNIYRNPVDNFTNPLIK